MKEKLTSRKFWLTTAAFLGAIGTGIAGYSMNDPALMKFGLICSILSAAIYAAAEAYVDGKRSDVE